MTTNELNTIIFVETAKKEALPDAPLAAQRTEAPLAAPKRCRPFSLSVMVYSPQSGYKIEVEIEKNCSPTNETILKFVFRLSKKNDQGVFDVLVNIQFTGTTPEETKGIATIAADGFTEVQSDIIDNEIYPPSKSCGDQRRNPTPQEKQQVDASLKKLITSKR